jgi:hypothetical protein
MEDQDEIVRSLAEYHGHSEEDAFAARDLLRLSPEDFVVRFAEVARFARTIPLIPTTDASRPGFDRCED